MPHIRKKLLIIFLGGNKLFNCSIKFQYLVYMFTNLCQINMGQKGSNNLTFYMLLVCSFGPFGPKQDVTGLKKPKHHV